MVTFATTDVGDDISEEAFEVLWNAPMAAEDQEQSIRAIQGPSIAETVLRLLTRKRPRRS